MTEDAAIVGRHAGRYHTVCGEVVPAASLTTTERGHCRHARNGGPRGEYRPVPAQGAGQDRAQGMDGPAPGGRMLRHEAGHLLARPRSPRACFLPDTLDDLVQAELIALTGPDPMLGGRHRATITPTGHARYSHLCAYTAAPSTSGQHQTSL